MSVVHPHSLFRYPVVAFVAAGLLACDGDGNDGIAPEPEPASFDRIQAHVFDAGCVDCHRAGSQFAVESGLVLEAGVSYDAVIGVEPRHAGARRDGFVLVAPGDPERSLLLQKLRWDLPPGAPVYGQPMPLGGPPLPVGTVEFVRRWIEEGAPEVGVVADAAFLTDPTPQQITAFLPLVAPARGYQLHLDRFPVQPSSERELFVYQRVGNAEELWVNRVEVKMRPNSHHFILYGFVNRLPSCAPPPHDEIRDLWLPDGRRNPDVTAGMACRGFIAGSQTEAAETRFPPGVALRLAADLSLDLNSHYVNRSDSVIYGEVYANLHTLNPGDVVHEAFPLFLNNLNINLPPHQETTVSRTFTMPQDVSVMMLTSHMHEKGERFVIRVIGGEMDGQVVYETTSWEHPEVVNFDPPLELAAGQGLRSEVTYYNPTSNTVRFGLTSEDEMAIIIGYFHCPVACGASAVQALSGEAGAWPVR